MPCNSIPSNRPAHTAVASPHLWHLHPQHHAPMRRHVRAPRRQDLPPPLPVNYPDIFTTQAIRSMRERNGYAIRGCAVVNADGEFRADVLCEGGKLVAVGIDLEIPLFAEVIDAVGRRVLPSRIDPHIDYGCAGSRHCPRSLNG